MTNVKRPGQTADDRASPSSPAILSWGANGNNLLFQGDDSDRHVPSLTRISLPASAGQSLCISNVCGGAHHTLLIDQHRRAYLNIKDGEGNYRAAMAADSVAMASVGWNTLLLLCHDGERHALMLMFLHKQLSRDNLQEAAIEIQIPHNAQFEVKKIQVCIRKHYLLLGNGELWSFTHDGNPLPGKGQVQWSLLATDIESFWSKADIFVLALGVDGKFSVMGDSKMQKAFQHGRVSMTKPLHVAVGWHHIVMITGSEGDGFTVHVFGSNNLGQLGVQLSTDPHPTSHTFSVKGRPIELVAGTEHSSILVERGGDGSGEPCLDILSWGWNEHGNCVKASDNDTENIKLPSWTELGRYQESAGGQQIDRLYSTWCGSIVTLKPKDGG